MSKSFIFTSQCIWKKKERNCEFVLNQESHHLFCGCFYWYSKDLVSEPCCFHKYKVQLPRQILKHWNTVWTGAVYSEKTRHFRWPRSGGEFVPFSFFLCWNVFGYLSFYKESKRIFIFLKRVLRENFLQLYQHRVLKYGDILAFCKICVWFWGSLFWCCVEDLRK